VVQSPLKGQAKLSLSHEARPSYPVPLSPFPAGLGATLHMAGQIPERSPMGTVSTSGEWCKTLQKECRRARTTHGTTTYWFPLGLLLSSPSGCIFLKLMNPTPDQYHLHLFPLCLRTRDLHLLPRAESRTVFQTSLTPERHPLFPTGASPGPCCRGRSLSGDFDRSLSKNRPPTKITLENKLANTGSLLCAWHCSKHAIRILRLLLTTLL